jgi:hypothetical protein
MTLKVQLPELSVQEPILEPLSENVTVPVALELATVAVRISLTPATGDIEAAESAVVVEVRDPDE